MEKDIKYFKAGDKLTAQALNDMLDNIAFNEEEVNKVKQATENVENFTSTVNQKATDAYDLANTALSGVQEAKILAEEAKILAGEAAQQGAQADYNENNSTLASYIKNRPFYEGFAFEPITWDGVVGDREIVDVSALVSGASIVKVSDTDLTYEELLDSIVVFNGGTQEKITADYMVSKEEGDAMGVYGANTPVLSIFDPELVQASFGTALSKGVYFIYFPNRKPPFYVTSLSKTIVKKIDEKFLPATASGANIEKGTGENATQQLQDQEEGVTEGYFNFTDKNLNATLLDPSLIGEIKYGASGNYSSAFGGKCAAFGKRSHAEGTTTIAKEPYSHAEGNSTVALGTNAHAEGLQTTAVGNGAHSEGELTIANGKYSHAEGRETISGEYAHAEGRGTKAAGEYSHAEGYETEAIGAGSHTSGKGTVANKAYQTIIGQYNDNKEKTIFEIGNGQNADNRSNAFEVYQDGTIAIKYNGKKYSLQKILEVLNAFVDDVILTD